MSTLEVPISFRLNGTAVTLRCSPGELLVSMIRERLHLHGTKISCAVEVCGACTVLVDGLPVSSCCYLAVDVDGRDVLTIEGARALPEFARIQEAFVAHAAVQCGFCTPGFVMTMMYLSAAEQADGHRDLAADLSGNLCRCTGYKSLLAAAKQILADDLSTA